MDTDKVVDFMYASYLEKAGYNNGYFGKNLNACPADAPPGFDCEDCYWFANGGGSDSEPGGYLNATFHDQNSTYKGKYIGNTAGEYAGYTTSIIANKSIEWVKHVAPLGKPFMVTVAPKAPHVPATPAPWYGTLFSDMKAPRTPNYNASKEVLADHHWLIAQQDIITMEQADSIDELFRNRWRTLVSVDDAIAAMVQTITDLNLMDSTYFFSTSDHGYQLGQMRLPSCKLNVYENDIRIPMVFRGPGIAPGTKFELPASNVDVAPTLLGLAGVDAWAVANMDGKSIIPLVVDPTDPTVPESVKAHIAHQTASEVGVKRENWRKFHFVEYYSLGSVTRTGHLVDDPNSNTYRAVRYVGPDAAAAGHGNMLYAQFTAVKDWHFENVSFHEMYDLDKDPYQLDNIYSSASPALLANLTKVLEAQYNCAAETCV